MLVLYFQLGDVEYAIRCDRVREVAPLVLLNRISGVAPHFAGIFRYRGVVVPVVDLGILLAKTPCRKRLSTRIILVEYLDEKRNETALLGLMAEKVTEAGRKPDDALLDAGLMTRNSRYFGGLLMERERMIRFLDLDRLVEDLGRACPPEGVDAPLEFEQG